MEMGEISVTPLAEVAMFLDLFDFCVLFGNFAVAGWDMGWEKDKKCLTHVNIRIRVVQGIGSFDRTADNSQLL
ncbi:hypothetical protein Csa_000563 [Cucumis sativus]|uniref:Uncharacterized protein n=1 Tax=Cucumis sativus TaxID=3659 RepID=A0A0A0KLM2_CUCSA|nr:hypothetical protein Csa_000563 [Cucumis sativus]